MYRYVKGSVLSGLAGGGAFMSSYVMGGVLWWLTGRERCYPTVT